MDLITLLIYLAIFAVLVAAVVYVMKRYGGVDQQIIHFVVAIACLIAILYIARALL